MQLNFSPIVSVFFYNLDCIFFLLITHACDETVADKGKPWFMYEAYQHILKVQVEFLIGLGINPALKVTSEWCVDCQGF